MSVARLEDIIFSYHTYREGTQLYGYAQHKGYIVGELKADLHIRQKYIDLFRLLVNKDYRRGGIATAFLLRLNEWGLENSATEICCAILPALLKDISSNEYGVALRKMGFLRHPYSELFRRKVEYIYAQPRRR